MLNLRFDHPEFLLLGLLAIPLVIIGWRALAMSDALRRSVTLGLRAALLLALAFILAGPHLQRQHDHLTVIGLLDISGSVQRFGAVDLDLTLDHLRMQPSTSAGGEGEPAAASPSHAQRVSIIEYLRQWFRAATGIREPDDRFGLVVFDGQAIAVSAPTRGEYVDDNLDISIAPGTNIEEAVRLGLAMFPPDTAKRLVLVTDGNETAGNVMEAVRRLSGAINTRRADDQASTATTQPQSAIPIDVLPLMYRVTGDVQVVRVEAPPTAQPGQTVTVRVVLEATAPTPGRLTLHREGDPVDLSPNDPGTSRSMTAPEGQSVHLAQVTLGQTPINRFEGVFEADDPRGNILPDNDRAEAFTATPSKGSVLVVDGRATQRENLLAQILNAADIPAGVAAPAEFPTDLLSLQNYDLIVLDNIAAHDLSAQQHQLIATYVNDLGGGLIMSGGEDSFGAGGWKGTAVADVLPVNLDPARQLRLPSAALVLVLDKSGSMNQPVAGARASQQEIANEGAALAIESLRQDNLVGVISFDMFAYTVVPLQANDQPSQLAEKVRGITADGGTNLEPALHRAFDMLRDVQVAKKRVVFLTDGRSASTENLEALALRMAAANIQLTTIAVGDDADYELLERLATVGGGEFYPVRDPRTLPRVLIDSVQVINKPLLKEISFTPQVLATGSTLTVGMQSAPPLDGLVITSVRDDPKVLLEMTDPDGEPLLAHWQAGLGRVAAFTSEAPGSGNWSRQWIDWPTAATFWTQLARTISRPAMNQDAELIASINNDSLDIVLELNESAAPVGSEPDNTQTSTGSTTLQYLQVDGTVYQPDGSTIPVRLRQTAPGRYETSVEAPLAGNYIVALSPRQGTRQLSPAIGGASRSTSPEFRRYESNIALLEQIMQDTGGRRLDMFNPVAHNLFDRAGMPPSVSMLPVWRTFLFWTLALLLLDVACRRIAWDYNLLRSYAMRAIERVTPARVRGERAAATLGTLRRVSDELDSRHQIASTGLRQLQATGRVAPPPRRDAFGMIIDDQPQDAAFDADASAAAAAARGGMAADQGRRAASGAPPQPGISAPDESRVSAALDALLGRSTSAKPAAPASPPASGDESRDDAGAKAAETTSGLLAAKRRARQQLDQKE